MLIGMIIMAVSFYLLSSMGIDTSKWAAMTYIMILGLGMGLVMPITTLALQEAFPKSDLGVVTSSSQFFRQIGGTFGMTVLGAVMNSVSSDLLKERLVPQLEKIPEQAKGLVSQFESMIQTNPQGLYSALLNPDTLKKIPDMIQQVMLTPLKTSLVDTLHYVFLFGMVFVILGTLITPFIGKITLSDSPKRPKKLEKAALIGCIFFKFHLSCNIVLNGI